MKSSILKILIVFITLTFAAAMSLMAATETVDGITWTYTVSGNTAGIGGGTASSTAVPTSISGAITIPSELGGYPVTSIGNSAFYNCSGLTRVTIPNSLGTIGNYAFGNCSGLTSVTLPNSVTNIGMQAFYNCTNLISVTIPDSVASIGSSAFSGCSGLEEITLPFVGACRGNTGNSDSLFGYIFGTQSYTGGTRTQQSYSSSYRVNYYIPSKLRKVVVSDETIIGYGALNNCSGFVIVTIPNSVTNIEAFAFSGCSGLANVMIPDNVTSIGNSAFFGCGGLTNISVGVDNVFYKSINGLLLTKDGETLVQGINGDVVIPDGVTSVEANAFYKCSGLVSVAIPSSVTSVGDSAFYCCSGLTNISVSGDNVFYKSVNGLLLTKDGETLVQGINGYVTIPDGVTSIGANAFYNCSGLTSITIPNSVTSIRSYAFSGCSGLGRVCISDVATWCRISFWGGTANPLSYAHMLYLNGDLVTNLVIPDSVTNIGNNAFYNCRGLTSVTIPAGVISIGDYAFYNCTELMCVTIPDDVTSIGNLAFSGCSALRDVTISQCVLDMQIRNVFSSAYLSLTNIAYSSTITNIGHQAFLDCSGLTSVTIPDGVTSIGSNAFCNCSRLTSVTIPNSVTRIEGDALSGCCGLEEITIPFVGGRRGLTGGKEALFGYVFGRSSYAGATEVVQYYQISSSVGVYISYYIPSKLRKVTVTDETVLGFGAFYGCSGLASVVIHDSVRSIGEKAFYMCGGLVSLTIPCSVTSIGPFAFSSCTGLTSIAIPDSITSIGKGWFSGCSGLMHVTIPTSVTSIASYAFNGCSGIVSLSIPDSVTSIESNAFLGCSGLRSVKIPQCVSSCLVSSIFPSAYQAITNVEISVGTTRIVDSAFSDCTSLIKVTVPNTVTYIGDNAFAQCSSLQSVVFNGDAPDIGSDIFEGTPKRMVVYVPDNSIGWSGGVTADLPSIFAERAIVHSGDVYDWGSEGVGERTVSMTITNVVVHYVLNSVVPEIAVPISGDTEFVNVVTEIKGGAIAVPDSWAANYPSFAEKFGSDISSALTKPTGKRDARGNAMMVWQDYVAGTDPTKEDDVFQASITMVDGVPQISYTPELPAEEKTKRKYTTYGKARLQDEEWHIVNEDAASYNFFKVTVEMK